VTKIITHIEALEKMRSYCAYQERSHQEVANKLFKFGLNQDEKDYVILCLMQGDYLNEQRYAEAFVSGKYRIKKWGRKKIILALKQKDVSEANIKLGLKEIDDNLYYQNLLDLTQKKWSLLKESNKFKKEQKLKAYLFGKGYESQHIQNAIDDLYAQENE